MTTNLAMDLRRIAQENERQHQAPPPVIKRSMQPAQRTTELQSIFRRLEAAAINS